MKVLLTTTSFQDTPGKHHDLLKEQKWDVDTLRGPLKEEVLLPIIADYDGIICGDDEITEKVIFNGKNGKLKAISKYGIGLDKIDIEAAKKYNIPVSNTPGVNHVAVAEHAFMFLLSHFKNFYDEVSMVRNRQWKRLIGHEVLGKKIAILGLGRIGKEFAIRCRAFGLDVWGYDIQIEKNFIESSDINFLSHLGEIDSSFEILSLHLPLNEQTSGVINRNLLVKLSRKILIINTARAGLILKQDLESFLMKNQESAYYCDVLWEEPINNEESLLNFSNVFITPHIGSRTYESVERQGSAAVKNLVDLI